MKLNTVVHCPTRELAKKVLKKAHNEGYGWQSNESYLINDRWDTFEDKTMLSKTTYLEFTTIQNNKMIAEFINLPKEVFSNGDLNYLFDGSYYEEHELSFNVSFDWIFAAVDYIESLVNEKDDNYAVTVFNETCYIKNTDIISSPECRSKLEAIYTTIMEFIKYYTSKN